MRKEKTVSGSVTNSPVLQALGLAVLATGCATAPPARLPVRRLPSPSRNRGAVQVKEVAVVAEAEPGPVAQPAPEPALPSHHLVGDGESLWGIALDYSRKRGSGPLKSTDSGYLRQYGLR